MYRIVFLVSCFILLLAQWISVPGGSMVEAPSSRSSFAHLREQVAQEIEMTRDPALNSIPKHRMKQVYAYLARLEQKRRSQAGVRAGLGDMKWQERGPDNMGGRTRTILVDGNDPTGNTLWVGSVSGGLWKCTQAQPASPVWTNLSQLPAAQLLPNLAITSLAQDFADPQKLYFGTGEGWSNPDAVRGDGLWYSQDGGHTWAVAIGTSGQGTSASLFRHVQKVVVHSDGEIFVATRLGG